MTVRLTRFGVLGDVHTEDEALAIALETLGGLELDAVLAVGDLLDGHGDPDRTCALLRDARVVAVTGNHDRWFLTGSQLGWDTDTTELHDAHRDWLASLPSTRRFDTPLGGLLLCHGVGEDDMAVLRPDTDRYSLAWLEPLHALCAAPELSLMVGGHTHERMVRAFDGLTVINAGTLHRDFHQGFLTVDLEARVVQAHDVVDGRVVAAERYDVPDVASR